jgi:murein DD-endopeptidase MepM/ murein hydrolase activator NlpD
LVLVAGRWWIIALIGVVASLLTAPAAGAAEPDTGWDEDTGIYRMVFPVHGDNRYGDTWGACRGANCSRSHEGNDIMANKMTPVVAAASGTVGWIADDRGGKCCALAINHDDGWRTWYIHMNNDTPGTDDGRGWGFAPGIKSGVRVEAGQLIGYVGDSGNAEDTPPHVHFELQQPDGTEIDPYPHLRQAEVALLESGIRFAADDTARVFINGVLVALSSEWTKATTLHRDFKPGDVIAVHATDAGGAAGFVAEITVAGQTLVSDATWRVTTSAPAGWHHQDHDDSGWAPAKSSGTYGMAPWESRVSGFPPGSAAEWIWSTADDHEVFLRYTIPGVDGDDAGTGSSCPAGDDLWQWTLGDSSQSAWAILQTVDFLSRALADPGGDAIQWSVPDIIRAISCRPSIPFSSTVLTSPKENSGSSPSSALTELEVTTSPPRAAAAMRAALFTVLPR